MLKSASAQPVAHQSAPEGAASAACWLGSRVATMSVMRVLASWVWVCCLAKRLGGAGWWAVRASPAARASS